MFLVFFAMVVREVMVVATAFLAAGCCYEIKIF